ncbi:MAG: thrombospondin type 3 repeat-containing protein, partial [Bdellovibrionales bacterium]|nr:thrombospondin type 3 repeat-containing protein [Bdellovibrionales bacterium]
TCNLSGSWSNIHLTGIFADDIDWTVTRGSTPTADTGPSFDATLGTASGHYAYLESSCPDIGHPNKEATLFSSCLNVGVIPAPELSFAYHMSGEDSNQILVEVSTNNCGSWTPVAAVYGQQQSSSNDGWKREVVNLVPWSGRSNLRIRFRGITGGSESGDIAIDDIEVRSAPAKDLAATALISPANGCSLTNTETVTVQIENKGYQAQSNFPVSYQVNGGTPVVETFTGSIPGGQVSAYTFTTKLNLSTTGSYTVSAKVNLTGDTRPDNNTVATSVVNIPVVKAFPYSENFEGSESGWIAGGTNSTWTLGRPSKAIINGAASGQRAWVNGGLTGLYKNNEQSYVVGPCFDFTNLSLPVLDMNVWWNSEGNWDGAVLQSSIDGGNTWQRVGTFGDPVNWYNDAAIIGNPGGQSVGWSGSQLDDSPNDSNGWVAARHPLSNLGGKKNVLLRVAFGSDPIIRDDGFAFDDVMIVEGVSVTKTASLIVDGGNNGKADAGDKIRYTVRVNNQSSTSVSGMIFDDTLDTNTSLVVGSVTTSKGTVSLGNGTGHTSVRVNIGTANGGSTVTITFDATVKPASSGSTLQICNQGYLNANSFTALPTDNPALNGSSDPTCLPAYGDSDGDGVPDSSDKCPGFDDRIDGDSDGTPDGCDQCPSDPHKIAPLSCGCNQLETDSDGDGTPNCVDQCPSDRNKVTPGICGCGLSDQGDSDQDGIPNACDDCPQASDADHDGTQDCNDGCPNDANKITPGICGCGVAETDSDNDGIPNCIDGCPTDRSKTSPGVCGCGHADSDSDGDGTPNCNDLCPTDSNKVAPGACGCNQLDTDSDDDGTPNCSDECVTDPDKIEPGACGCGVTEVDGDGDGEPDCTDLCPVDPAKVAPGTCGCGVADTDSDEDGILDCRDDCPTDGNKSLVGVCGCGVPDIDSDGDRVADCEDECPANGDKSKAGVCGCDVEDKDSDFDGMADCKDACPFDSNKGSSSGVCGCGIADSDLDGDGTPDCQDECPNDPLRVTAGECGCGERAEADLNANGIADCKVNLDFQTQAVKLKVLFRLVKKKRKGTGAKVKAFNAAQNIIVADTKNVLANMTNIFSVSASDIQVTGTGSLQTELTKTDKMLRKAMAKRGGKLFPRWKKRGNIAIRKLFAVLGI